MVVTITGPSGSGKSTIARALCDASDVFSEIISVTTRPPREGETDGVDYKFFSEEGFRALLKANVLLEHTEYDGHFYGALQSDVNAVIELNKIAVLVCNFDGMQQIEASFYESLSFFIAPPLKEVLKKRMRDRLISDLEIERRLALVGAECANQNNFDYVIESAKRSVNEMVNEISFFILEDYNGD